MEVLLLNNIQTHVPSPMCRSRPGMEAPKLNKKVKDLVKPKRLNSRYLKPRTKKKRNGHDPQALPHQEKCK